MREFLEPIFGQWGAVVVQFLLTVAIVLALLGMAIWFVRRYSGIRLGGIGRGRVPRLAVVDALPVDRRRKLVLIRRDNVEHLLLLGGPGDVVVETAIQRVRQRNPQQAAQMAAARAAMQQPAAPAEAPHAPPEEPAPASEPIPFPVARNNSAQRAAGTERPSLRSVRLPPPPAPEPMPEPEPEPVYVAEAEPERAMEPEPVANERHEVRAAFVQTQIARALPTFAPNVPAEQMREPYLPEMTPTESEELPEQSAPQMMSEAEADADEANQPALDLGDSEAPATAAEEEPQSADGEAARVSDLEAEMARLLDEITARRGS